MANPYQKEKLFSNFRSAALQSFKALEEKFGVSGLCDQVFGKHAEDERAKDRFRASSAWVTLSELFDYAVDGVQLNVHAVDIVIGGAEVISLASSENSRPSPEWDQIIAMGDGRFALDAGDSVMIGKVALLAKVDIRTVRNAISAGELASEKVGNEIFIENASARCWLHTRKGYRPTVPGYMVSSNMEDIVTPAQFGAFLSSQRQRVGHDDGSKKLTVFHRSVNAQELTNLEAGIFSVPLDAVFPLADFYQIGRRELLDCVMRVFFREELNLLMNAESRSGGSG
jgi:hypothetical protein